VKPFDPTHPGRTLLHIGIGGLSLWARAHRECELRARLMRDWKAERALCVDFITFLEDASGLASRSGLWLSDRPAGALVCL